MIHFVSKLSQIFSLLALCILGLMVALLFVQADLENLDQEAQTACGTVSPDEYLVEDTTYVSDTVIMGKALFNNNCQQCHSAGAEVIVGPGLKGILERRTLDWIIPWVQNSQKMIAAGDPYGTALYNKYNKTQMQSFKLTADEIKAIMAYVQRYRAVVADYSGKVVSCK